MSLARGDDADGGEQQVEKFRGMVRAERERVRQLREQVRTLKAQLEEATPAATRFAGLDAMTVTGAPLEQAVVDTVRAGQPSQNCQLRPRSRDHIAPCFSGAQTRKPPNSQITQV